MGLFLDDASRARLAATWPASAGARSASYVLLEPAARVADPKLPAVYAPLMQERATAKVAATTRLPSGALALTMACELNGSALEGLEHVPCASFGHLGGEDSDADADYAAAELRTNAGNSAPHAWGDDPPLSGVICKSEYFVDGACHLPPMLKCPLCQFMEDSPCAAPFKVWEDCLNACEGGDGDDDARQEKFMAECAEPTLALKACVEKYPDHFGAMFGAGDGAAPQEPAGDAAPEAPAGDGAAPEAPPEPAAPPAAAPPERDA